MRRKQFLKKTLSVTLAAVMALTVSQATTFAETDSILNGISSYAAENNETYKYVYAGLTWSEYWKSEDVYEAENVQSSDEQDSRVILGIVQTKRLVMVLVTMPRKTKLTIN